MRRLTSITKASLAALLLGLSCPLLAQNPHVAAYVCNNCTPGQILDDVKYQVAGDYFIYDFNRGFLTHYVVAGAPSRNVLPSSAPVARNITMAPITDGNMKVFRVAQALYTANKGLDVFGLSSVSTAPSADRWMGPAFPREHWIVAPLPSIDRNGRANAFDMVSTPAFRQRVIDVAVKNNVFSASVRPFVANLLNLLPETLGMKTPINVFINVNFPDGSSSRLKWDSTVDLWSYVEGSSKDQVGNPIPETSIDAAGGSNSSRTYFFPGTDGGQFAGRQQIHQMNLLGINFPVERYGGSWILACSNMGGITNCVTRPW